MFSGWYFGTCRFRFIGLAAFILLTAPMPATASEHQWAWTIVYVDGAVRTGEGNGVWWSMRLGEKIRPGDHIETGPDARMTLVNGGDSIEVAPNSRFAVLHKPEAVSPEAVSVSLQPDTGEHAESDIIQTFGSLLFRMESRESRDFSVETPYLAAAIKGTTFTVTVSRNNAIVTVEEGSVEVTADRTGEIALVEAGGIAAVSRGGAMDVVSGSEEADATPEKNDVPESSGGGGSDRDHSSTGGFDGGTRDTGGTTSTADAGGTTGTTDTGGTTGTTDTGGTGTTDTGGTTDPGRGGAIGDFASGLASPKK